MTNKSSDVKNTINDILNLSEGLLLERESFGLKLDEMMKKTEFNKSDIPFYIDDLLELEDSILLRLFSDEHKTAASAREYLSKCKKEGQNVIIFIPEPE